MDQDNRPSRREIANSNERRRMQCINTGFQQLRSLLPLRDDDKLSKSGILQQAINHINALEQDRTRLKLHNQYLSKQFGENNDCENDDATSQLLQHPVKRKKCDIETSIATCKLTAILGDRDEENLDCGSEHSAELRLAQLEKELTAERQRRVVAEDLIGKLLSKGTLVRKRSEDVGVSKVKAEKISEAEQIRQIVASMASDTTLMSDSMSRRNLDTIVEAIRHLEGEPSAALVKRLRLSNSGFDSSRLSVLGDQITLQAAGSQVLLRSNDEVVSIPAVAAFEELVSSGEQQIYISCEPATAGTISVDSITEVPIVMEPQ